MQHSSRAAIVFDFDGTLAQSTIDFKQMKRAVAVAIQPFFDTPTSPDKRPVLEWLAVQAAAMRATDHARAEAMLSTADAIIREVEVEAAAKGALFDSTRSALDELRRLGARISIITRNCRPAVLTVFPDIEDHVDAFFTRDDVLQVKPHPSHLLTALEAMGAAEVDSLMVGDHVMDVETGKRAGVRTAAVLTGNSTRQALERAAPDRLAEDVPDLLRQLKADGFFGES